MKLFFILISLKRYFWYPEISILNLSLFLNFKEVLLFRALIQTSVAHLRKKAVGVLEVRTWSGAGVSVLV